jgi:hypothetical protein
MPVLRGLTMRMTGAQTAAEGCCLGARVDARVRAHLSLAWRYIVTRC